jgi:hypothetical protein
MMTTEAKVLMVSVVGVDVAAMTMSTHWIGSCADYSIAGAP